MFDFKKHLIIGQKIQLELAINNETRQYLSQIEGYSNDDTIEILTPISQNRLVYLPNDTTLKVIIFKGDAVFDFKAKVIEKKLGTIPTVKLQIVSGLNKTQRRNYFRLKVIKDMEARLVENLKENKFGEKFKGNMLDISAGGVLMIASKELQEGDIVEFALPLSSGKNIILFGKIVRKSYTVNAKYKYEYGLQFENISEFERNEITKYIFEEQRKMIKKGLI